MAAFLWAQLEEADRITASRLACWTRDHELLGPLESKGLLRRPVVPQECRHNAHMDCVLLLPGVDRDDVLARLKSAGINCERILS